MGVPIKCKQCGRTGDSDKFVLDYVYKKVVCENCAKERKNKGLSEQKPASVENNSAVKELAAAAPKQDKKPAGWDQEDDALNKAYERKKANQDAMKQEVLEKVDDEKVKYKCRKCGYVFTYNQITKTPRMCPYCSTPIAMFENLSPNLARQNPYKIR